MNELHKRLALFACIEPGIAFWGREIAERGASATYNRLLDGRYDTIKYSHLIEKISSFNCDEGLAAIAKAGGTFITPESIDWPKSVDDLAVPPIALIVKGDSAILSERSLAIVGTRNPTPYGIRIAGDFAAGFVDRDWQIISGGAYGVDTAAHRGALVAEGRTIAVIAS
jgi:DNA processing protein